MDTVDLAFSLTGTTLPLDHGYALYAGVCQRVRQLRGLPRVGLHPIRGRYAGESQLLLNRASFLKVRLCADLIPVFLPLAGQVLELNGHTVRIGTPRVYALRQADALAARIVTVKGFLEPGEFLSAVRRQMQQMHLPSQVTVDIPTVPAGHPNAGQPLRRVLRIKDRTIVGFAVQVGRLKPEDSIRLQEHGLGGRRHMGCGVFVPKPRRTNDV